MLAGFVLLICTQTEPNHSSVFSKLVGFEIGPQQTIEECHAKGAATVANLSPIFNGVRYICHPRTKHDTINGIVYEACD